ncbi:hypothetical protein AK830_g8392 [Neonectria ditissima]|uniref:Uncharacterized protein n=1 Tax=Neonectria ditissima TaxID=78410 RepID=A0A0P7BCF9_9HYPO|nr:hypothetical protein AK830_g8392 [Neonectria ditissima]
MAESLGKSQNEQLWSSSLRSDGSDENSSGTLPTHLDLGKHRRQTLETLNASSFCAPPRCLKLDTKDGDAHEPNSTTTKPLQPSNSDVDEGYLTTQPTNDLEDADAPEIGDSNYTYTYPTVPPNSPRPQPSKNTTPFRNEGADAFIAPSHGNIQADGLPDDLLMSEPDLLNKASVSPPKQYPMDEEHTKSLIKDLLRTLGHHETTLGRPIDVNKDSALPCARSSLSHVLLLVREIDRRYCQPPGPSSDSDQTPNHMHLPVADFGAPCRSYTAGPMDSSNIPNPNSGRVPRHLHNGPGMAVAGPVTRIQHCAAARAA